MFTPQRRHTKPSPPAVSETSSAETANAVTGSPLLGGSYHGQEKEHPHKGGSGVGGIFSHFANRARRRFKVETDTLLPTNFAASPPVQHLPLTCNNFLMGGNYYPGKDKKRRHMSRRTLWYRLFCSSPGRKAGSFFLILYVAFWHVLLPTTEWLLQVGARLSYNTNSRRAKTASWLQYEDSLHIPEFLQEQKMSVELAAARARLQLDSNRKAQRLKLLEDIVPTWFHRNDPTSSASKHEHQSHQGTMKQEHPAEHRKVQSDQAGDKADGNAPDNGKKEAEKATEMKDRRILKMDGSQLPVRTIHSSLEESNQLSKCQSIQEFSTTLVTQTSMSRLWILKETCKRWTDPIIAVIFIPHGEKEVDAAQLSACSHLQIIEYMANEEESKGENYPVNRLRNVGLDAVTTSHVLVMDVDFVPAEQLSETIRDALELRHTHHSDVEDTQALVVPAFERLPPKPCETEVECAAYLQTDNSFIPETFEDLRLCVAEKNCIVFQSDNNLEGHFTTRSDRWLQRNWYDDPDEKTIFATIPCFFGARYEPYVVLRWCSKDSSKPIAPFYDERFHGYGKNKIELVSHLRKKGYTFSILPEGFIVHNPHPESAIKEKWNDRAGHELHSAMDKLYTVFLDELERIYQEVHASSIKLCKHR